MKTDFAKGAAWAIVPEQFDLLVRQQGELKITDEMILQAEKQGALVIGGSEGGRKLYATTEEGVAIIKIQGAMMKSPDWIDRIYLGYIGYEDIQAAFSAAVNDPQVNGIVLDIDSPGGTVAGADETGELIFDARGEKPIVAFSSGMMTSAAYWIGSATDKIVIGKNANVGSIGVLLTHKDFTDYEHRVGVTTTYLKAGKHKAFGAGSLSDEARENFLSRLNHFYGNFKSAIALYRDTEDAKVNEMADGQIFIGVQAVGAGLADEIGNLQTAISYAAGESAINISAGGINGTGETKPKGINQMKIENYEQLKAAAPDILKAAEDTARAEGVKSVDIATPAKEAASAQQAQLIGLAEVHFGAEAGAKFKALIESGISVEQYKASVAAIGTPKPDKSAEEAARLAALEALKSSGADNPGPGNPADSGKGYMALVDEYRAMHKCSKTDAMMAVNKSHPRARQDYLEKANPGLTVAK